MSALAIIDKKAGASFIFHLLKPGETKEFELPSEDGHEIKVSDASGNVLNQETYMA